MRLYPLVTRLGVVALLGTTLSMDPAEANPAGGQSSPAQPASGTAETDKKRPVTRATDVLTRERAGTAERPRGSSSRSAPTRIARGCSRGTRTVGKGRARADRDARSPHGTSGSAGPSAEESDRRRVCVHPRGIHSEGGPGGPWAAVGPCVVPD